LTPPDVVRTVKLRLASELADDRASLEDLARSTASLLDPAADARDEWMRPLALAFLIERWYTAAEATFSRALRTLDGDVPAGGTWHQEPAQASVPSIEGGANSADPSLDRCDPPLVILNPGAEPKILAQ